MRELRRLFRTRAPLVVGLVAAGLALATATAAAQMAWGSLVGVVRDEQGGVLPGATVIITEVGTNLVRESVTDPQGAYNFVNVLPGRYDVRVSMPSFRETIRTGVPVTVGQISRVDVTMEVGALEETVTVQSEAQLLQTDRADVRTDLRSEEVTNLPLNQFRNYQSLVVLVPGSLPPTFQNAETDTPQRSLNMTVNGQSGNANSTRTDGTANTFVTMPHHTAYVSPAETIESVSITTGSMSAEQGMAAGAAINVVTKSGTNTLRGSAFEFFNNEKLNAAPYYFGRGALPAKLPIERQIFGGTLGGPIKRNHVFFFGSYEGYLSRLEQYAFFSVPDAALRNGDFSSALNADGSLQRIYDPLSANLLAATAGRAQFTNNMIPGDRIHPISRALLAMYPMPNIDGTGAGGLTNNYRTIRRSTTDRHNFDFKLNWNRTPAHQIWGKVSHMNALVDDLFTFPIGESDDDGGDTKVWQIAFGHTWTLGPTLLLDGSLGIATQDQFVSSPDFHMGMIGQQLGIPGTNDQGRGDPRYAGMPQFTTGFTPLGNTPAWSPIYRDELSQSLNLNVTKLTGAHDIKAGYFLNHLTLDDWQPSVTNPRGVFTFATNATRTFGAGSQTGNFYNQYAAFLLGMVGTAAKAYQFQNFTGNEYQHALYVRDRWTPRANLTLDLGLRWEYYPMLKRQGWGMERLDLNTLEMVLGGLGGNPRNVGLESPNDLFAPRVGAVYRLNDDTVVRAGYGLMYDGQSFIGEFAFYGYRSYPLTLNATFQPPATETQFGWYGTIEQGIPRLEDPDLSSGRLPLPNTVAIQTAVPESVNRGKTHSYNIAFERRLRLASVDVAFVHNRVNGALMRYNINNAQSMGGGGLDRPYLVSHGRQLAVDVYAPLGSPSRDYKALQVGISRPLRDGLLLKGHYTYSSSWAMTTSYELPTAEAQARNWAPAGGSRPHTFTMAFLYQLPWQSDVTRGNIAKVLIRDWQLNGVLQAFNGAPFTVTASATELNTPGNTQTADLIGGVRKVGQIGADGFYYDPAAWAQPEGVRFGNTLINQFRGPGGWNLDLSIFRAFPLRGNHRLEARIEATNITDTPKFGNPTSGITSGDFMRVFSLNNAFTERRVRLGIRYSF
jgi:outer membrane receptor protein involved in Fe transport